MSTNPPVRQTVKNDYEAAGQSVNEYMAQVEPLQRAKRKRRKTWTILLVLLLLAVAAGGAFYYLTQIRTTESQSIKQDDETLTPIKSETNVAVVMENYVSTGFGLSFEHPNTWTVDEETVGQLIVASPELKLEDAAGQSVDGKILVNIRKKGAVLSEFDDGNAIAARASEKITYTTPSSNQRGQTYLSFLRYAGTAGDGMEAVYVTGDNGYILHQAVPKVDIQPVDPQIIVMFNSCSGSSCAAIDNPNFAINPDTWDSNLGLLQAKAILQSLTIR